jgi:hypothetical protein
VATLPYVRDLSLVAGPFNVAHAIAWAQGAGGNWRLLVESVVEGVTERHP